ncbi:MAG: hypothetical protein DMF61_07365 [Blastocatellia bacterium AA13]|nr:MAG: hypothetical protein DMF61_07365 [Blastocatellia bacterium AA13]
MTERIDKLPVVLTSFAYREEYFRELDGLLTTVREHHPDWLIVAGRGPVSGLPPGSMEVESPWGTHRWTPPVALDVNDFETAFFNIVSLKPWWISQVWRMCSLPDDGRLKRVLWSDADNRFNGPLDIELQPDSELVSGCWSQNREMICGGLLLFQGKSDGTIHRLIDEWSQDCLGYTVTPPPVGKENHPEDQERLTELLGAFPYRGGEIEVLKLDINKYLCCPTDGDKIERRGLVESWYMSARMQRPENRNRNWPPPEEYRRHAMIGDSIPDANWDPYES